MSIFLFQIVIAINVFLIILNGYLRGKIKDKIDIFLGGTIFILLISGFIFYAWYEALLTIFLAFVYGIFLNVFAKYTAFKVLGYRTSINNKDKNLQDLFCGKKSMQDYFKTVDIQHKKDMNKLQRWYHNKDINKILEEAGKDFNSYSEIYKKIQMSGLNRKAALDVVSRPKKLKKYIHLVDEGVSDIQIAYLLKRM